MTPSSYGTSPYGDPSSETSGGHGHHSQQYAYALSPARGKQLSSSLTQSLAGSFQSKLALSPEPAGNVSARQRNRSEHDASTEWDIAGNDRKYDFVSVQMHELYSVVHLCLYFGIAGGPSGY